MTISKRIQEHEESRLSSAGNKPLDLLMKHHIIKYNHHHGTTCTVSISYLPVKSPAWWINRRRSWRLSKQSWTWPTSGLHSSLTRRGAFTTKNWMSPFFHHFFFSGGLSTSLSAFNQHSNAASITEIDGFSMGSSDIWIHGTGEIRDSHAECNRFWLQP